MWDMGSGENTPSAAIQEGTVPLGWPFGHSGRAGSRNTGRAGR